MGSEWFETNLGEISTDVSYGYTESASTDKVGPHFLRITDIQNGVVDWSEVPYCPISDAKKQHYLLSKGDIVVARTGNSTGENYIFTGEEETVFASYLIRFKINPDIANAYYVWYTMRSPDWWCFVQSSKTGSAQAGANAKVLGSYPLKLPSLARQKYVAHTLGTLDNKIELNRKTNETLEQMAQALFKGWFVDFDPVIDNALEAGNTIPDELQDRAERRKQQLAKPDHQPLPDDVRQLFPSEFELTDELDWVPMGWEVKPLYLLADFINGATLKKFEPNATRSGLPIIKIAELKSGITENTGFSDIEMPKKYLISDNDILFSWSGNPDTSIDTFVWSHGNAWLNQHIFKVIPAAAISHSFLLAQLRHLKPVFTEIARDKQTTGLGHVTVKDLKTLMVVIPSNGILEKATALLEPIYGKSLDTAKTSQKLAKLRDTLLPKLISGELRLPSDAEQQPAAANS